MCLGRGICIIHVVLSVVWVAYNHSLTRSLSKSARHDCEAAGSHELVSPTYPLVKEDTSPYLGLLIMTGFRVQDISDGQDALLWCKEGSQWKVFYIYISIYIYICILYNIHIWILELGSVGFQPPRPPCELTSGSRRLLQSWSAVLASVRLGFFKHLYKQKCFFGGWGRLGFRAWRFRV